MKYADVKAHLESPRAAVFPIGPDALHTSDLRPNMLPRCPQDCPAGVFGPGDSYFNCEGRPDHVMALVTRWFKDFPHPSRCRHEAELVERLCISHLDETEFEWMEPLPTGLWWLRGGARLELELNAEYSDIGKLVYVQADGGYTMTRMSAGPIGRIMDRASPRTVDVRVFTLREATEMSFAFPADVDGPRARGWCMQAYYEDDPYTFHDDSPLVVVASDGEPIGRIANGESATFDMAINGTLVTGGTMTESEGEGE